MNLTLKEIRVLVAQSGPPQFDPPLAVGKLISTSVAAVDYEMFVGWNIQAANLCDETWGVFNIKLMRYIRAQNYSPEELAAVLSKVQLDDSHWRWVEKSLFKTDTQYEWFFLMAEGFPQAACLIFYPKLSAINGQSIFYIEYIAVAPWNRENPMAGRAFKGVGKVLLDHICTHATQTLGLLPGFSLHALDKATGFYNSIGMLRFPQFDKPSLPFFEMPPSNIFQGGTP